MVCGHAHKYLILNCLHHFMTSKTPANDCVSLRQVARRFFRPLTKRALSALGDVPPSLVLLQRLDPVAQVCPLFAFSVLPDSTLAFCLLARPPHSVHGSR